MKKIMIGLTFLAFVTSALAIDKVDLHNRVLTLTAEFDALQQNPERAVPADVLKNAQGIVLLDRTKAGFLFAYQGGGGLAMVRDPRTGKWGAPAFVDANEASLGFQVGAEQTFFVILLMNTNVTHSLTEPNFNFGGEARATAGDQSAGQQGLANPPPPSVFVYDDREGLYAGASIKGGALTPDDEANSVYYDVPVSMSDILFDKRVKSTRDARDLARRINYYANPRPSQ